MRPEEAEVKQWLEKADRDRRLAVAALSQLPPITDGAAFHCQQSVEKLLKAYLVFHGEQFEKVHDVRLLVGRCARLDPLFDTLAVQVAPLNAFAVRFRYPGPEDPSVADVERALEVVAEAWRFVLARLPAEVWH